LIAFNKKNLATEPTLLYASIVSQKYLGIVHCATLPRAWRRSLNASVGEGLKPLLYGIILKETATTPIFTEGQGEGSQCNL
jgi:hypothetical protein